MQQVQGSGQLLIHKLLIGRVDDPIHARPVTIYNSSNRETVSANNRVIELADGLACLPLLQVRDGLLQKITQRISVTGCIKILIRHGCDMVDGILDKLLGGFGRGGADHHRRRLRTAKEIAYYEPHGVNTGEICGKRSQPGT